MARTPPGTPSQTTLAAALALCGLTPSGAADWLGVEELRVRDWIAGRAPVPEGVFRMLGVLYGRMTDAALATAASSGPWVAEGHPVPERARVNIVEDPYPGHGEVMAGAMAVLIALGARRAGARGARERRDRGAEGRDGTPGRFGRGPGRAAGVSGLREVELRLVDDLTGMRTGYVLDFTNASFAAFFRDEVGIDIKDDAYAEGSNSKGKRLRAFLQRGQPRAVAGILAALWELREDSRIREGKVETVPDARARLSAIIERLGGAPLPGGPDAGDVGQARSGRPTAPSATTRTALRAQFLGLHELAPQPRGYAFERFLTALFDAWGLDARAGFSNRGEQIDGSFVLDGATYLLEAKWQARPADAATLHGFAGKVGERALWARGLFVSYAGFSSDLTHAFTPRQVLLMDGMDVIDLLSRDLDLDAVLRAKGRHAVERKAAFASTRTLFP